MAVGDRQQWSGNAKDLPMVERVIVKLEGLLQEIKDKKQDDYATEVRAMPAVYVASHLGCAPGSVKRWLKQHHELRATNDISARFIEVFGCIANELAESLASKTFDIAYNTAHPSAFNAQKWLLPIMAPEVYGDQPVELDRAPEAADHSQEVHDELNEEEREEITRLAAELDAGNKRYDELLAGAAKRVEDGDQ